jgi:small subunit ribosomal protein S17
LRASKLIGAIQKFNGSKSLLVHDPNSSLRTGDVISISPGWRTSKRVHHVVSKIIAPFGDPIEARPPVPTEEERVAEREARMAEKRERRRRRDVEALSEEELVVLARQAADLAEMEPAKARRVAG